MELEQFDGWTIDRRLKQLRKIRSTDDKILFVDFDDELGQMIFEKKILIDEMHDLIDEQNWLENAKKLQEKNILLNHLSILIKDMEGKLK